MKNAWKTTVGIILSGLVIASVSAETADLIFNRVRICVESATKTVWNQNITDTDLPSSITYKDTTYVPLRWISENMDKKVAWNGDSKTVSIVDSENTTFTSPEVTKEDINGNVWEYYIKTKDNDTYLIVSDDNRGYERCYGLAHSTGYHFTDEGVYYVDKKSHNLYYMPFLNDENSQDGVPTGIHTGGEIVFDFCFDGDYLIWGYNNIISTTPNGNLCIANIKTNETNSQYINRTIYGLEPKKLDDSTYEIKYYKNDNWTNNALRYVISVNKDTMEFGESEKVLRVREGSEYYADELTLKNFTFLKKDMSIEEIADKVGENGIVEEEYICCPIDGNNDLLLKMTDGKLSEVFVKIITGETIPVPLRDDGTYEIYAPEEQEG